MSRPAAADRPLMARAGRALGWSLGSTVINRFSTLFIGIALARILGPAEFGTFAVALVALLAVLSFNELGVSLAIVRWPNDPREIAPTVATLSVLSSLVIYVICFVAAPSFAAAMGEPAAAPVIRVLAVSVVVSGLVATPVALLQREFRQDRKTVADLATNWTSALTSITLALSGLGALSLAVGQLVGSVVGAVLFVIFEPRGLRFGFDRSVARALLRFGLPLAGSSIVVFAVANVDRLMVGALLGPVALGYYVLAINLSNWPVSVLSQPVRAVAPAALARLQADPPAMRRTFFSTLSLLAAVTVPLCVLLAATAETVVTFVYGEAWGPAAAVLAWLGLLAAVRILFELVYDYFVVLARTRVVLVVQFGWLVALVPALYLATRTGELWAAGAAQLAVALLVIAPIYLLELARVGIAPGRVARRLVAPLLGASVTAAVAVGVAAAGPHGLVVLAIAGLAGLGTVAVLGYRLRGVFRELRSVGQTDPATDLDDHRTTAGDQASGTSSSGRPEPSAGTAHTSLVAVPSPARGSP